MSLTDDWKNKKLKLGQRFFISINGNKPEPATIDMDGDFVDMEGMPVNLYTNEIEVLAPCDYDQLQQLKGGNKRMTYDLGNQGYKIKNQRHEINNRLKENEKLRTLLKECQRAFETYAKEDETCGLGAENLSAFSALPTKSKKINWLRYLEISLKLMI